MTLSPDDIVFFYAGPIAINATLLFTWIVMLILLVTSRTATRNIQTTLTPGKWQSALEVVLSGVQAQIDDIAPGEGERYLPFAATLFLFILVSNLLGLIPGAYAPTASLSTTTALAIAALLAVPAFTISKYGIGAYLGTYMRPYPVMLPFNIISAVSRTLALAVRLYGNIMSGAVLVAILLSIAPFFFPVIMQGLGLITGVVQAYIFAVLATVYVASADQSARRSPRHIKKETSNG